MTLNSCPFCGNDIVSDKNMATLKLVRIPRKKNGFGLDLEYPQVEYYVKCGYCGARSGSIFAGYNALTKRTITEEQAREIAISKWDNRS